MANSSHHHTVNIAYIGGGSLNWATKLMADLAQDRLLAAHVRLYDLDHDAAVRNARIGARFAEVSKGYPARYDAVRSIEEALTGADVVVVSILPGEFEDMAHDIDIPAAYGIRQAVGDTVGPGGFVRALRSIPMMVEIAEAIRKTAPKAWVCNLTNPMSALTGAMYRAFPEIRLWGECHEVTKLRHQVAWIGNRELGSERFSHRDVTVNVLGINHFTFVGSINIGSRDMMPAYRAFAQHHGNSGWAPRAQKPGDEHDHYFMDRSRVKFDLLGRFGIPAAAGDRHLAEFLPQAQYLDEHEAWDFTLTPVSYRERDRAQKRARADALAAGEGVVHAERSDEALVDQIKALLGFGDFVSNVNLPNRGQLGGVHIGAIVETNALFSASGVTPLVAGRLPDELLTIVADHADRQTAMVGAVMENRWNDLFDLFHSDPLVAPLAEAEARRMFGEMIAATSHHLPRDLVRTAA
ncbi:family 4 glycosyl hydrolase [Flavimaricola marinus]|uniref:Alpha-galacturonidase n=1 Tax=Flavimaricola marinus TaxID=1819565 RepID=A0A238LDU1_9RHOB|nr:alpha-galactosidase [Flavimaricola marinus]SMY07575.1 Alpha-galacturonidase [Flavimaricola marinus]